MQGCQKEVSAGTAMAESWLYLLISPRSIYPRAGSGLTGVLRCFSTGFSTGLRKPEIITDTRASTGEPGGSVWLKH